MPMLLLIYNRSILQSSKLQPFYSTMFLSVFTFCYSLHSKQDCVFILTVVIPAAAPVIGLQLDLFSQQLYLPLLLSPYLTLDKDEPRKSFGIKVQNLPVRSTGEAFMKSK